MPTLGQIRSTIIKRIRKDDESVRNGSKQISRRNLLRAVGSSYRVQADDMIGALVAEGVLNIYGTGRRGHPQRIGLGPNWPDNICPCCLQKIPK